MLQPQGKQRKQAESERFGEDKGVCALDFLAGGDQDRRLRPLALLSLVLQDAPAPRAAARCQEKKISNGGVVAFDLVQDSEGRTMILPASITSVYLGFAK